MDLIRRFDEPSYAQALESWQWLDGMPGLTPVLTNAFGDPFLQGPDGAFSFLDTMGGRLERRWPDGPTLQTEINTPDAQANYLLVGIVAAADAAGLEPGPGQVLAWKVPPILGGEPSVENLEVADFVVAVNLAGQIHRQVSDLPPGTPIGEIRIE